MAIFRHCKFIVLAGLALSPTLGSPPQFEEGLLRSSVIERRTDLTLIPGERPMTIHLLGGGRHDWGRLHLKAEGAVPAGDWRLDILDRSGGVFVSIPARELAGQSGDPTRFETRPLSEDVIQVRVSANGPRLSVVGIERGIRDLKVETTCGLLTLRTLDGQSEAIRRAAAAIGLLEFSIDGENVTRCNTSLVAPRVAMTNDHCIPQDRTFSPDFPPRVYFFFKSNQDPGRPILVSRYLAGDPELDLSLLELEEDPQGVETLSFEDSPVAKDAPLRLVQHYRDLDWRKLVSLDPDCKVFADRATGRFGGADLDLLHGCDTDPGSSGAPVLDMQGFVVGLHHWGNCPEQYNQASRGDLIREKIQSLRNQFPGASLP